MPGGIVAPDHFPVRQPTDANQVNGRIVNSVRYMELGGLSSASKYPRGNAMRVERATSVRAAHGSTNKND